jgi:hypothetical protein
MWRHVRHSNDNRPTVLGSSVNTLIGQYRPEREAYHSAVASTEVTNERRHKSAPPHLRSLCGGRYLYLYTLVTVHKLRTKLRNMLLLYCDELLGPCPNSMLEDHPLSAILDSNSTYLQLTSTFGSKMRSEMHKRFGGKNEGKRPLKRSR